MSGANAGAIGRGRQEKPRKRHPTVAPDLHASHQSTVRAKNLKAKSRRDGRSELWLCFGLGLLILIFYANSFSAGLLFDSDILIRQDPRLRALSRINIEQILTHDYWWPAQESIVYRPVTTFSYLFNYTVLGNGENPGGY